VSGSSLELPGLTAHLDRLCYHNAGAAIPAEKRHVFVYFITLRNQSDRTVTLLGRKWVIENENGTQLVVEGDKIVGETPRLEPGEQFSYNSCHLSGSNALVRGSFHGADEAGAKIHVLLDPFALVIPPAEGGGPR
jgi:ApaG protein